MAKKLSDQNIKAIGALLVAGAGVAHEVWASANKDGRLSDALSAFGKKVSKAASIKKPTARLERQLALIEDHAREAMSEQSEPGTLGRGSAEQAQVWLARASVLKAKLPLLEAQSGKDRRKNFKELQNKTASLLDEIIAFGLDANQR